MATTYIRYPGITSVPSAAFPLLAPNGTAAAPSYSFSSENSGIFRPGAGTIGFSISGTQVAQFAAAGLQMSSGQFLALDGSAAQPSHSFSNDGDSGMFSAGSNSLSLAVGGSTFLNLSSSKITGLQVFAAPLGANTGPSYAISGDSNTGMYSAEADSLDFSAGGLRTLTVSTSGVAVQQGALAIASDFSQSSSAAKIGFFGATAVVRTAAYTITNVTPDRAYDANATSVDELADVLGTLIADLKLYGFLQ